KCLKDLSTLVRISHKAPASRLSNEARIEVAFDHHAFRLSRVRKNNAAHPSMKQIVVSREWKVLLKTTRFYGSRSTLQKAAQTFWSSFSNSIESIAIGVDGSLTAIEKQKTVSFYDTGGRHLHSNN